MDKIDRRSTHLISDLDRVRGFDLLPLYPPPPKKKLDSHSKVTKIGFGAPPAYNLRLTLVKTKLVSPPIHVF